jgi:hypothetical protein
LKLCQYAWQSPLVVRRATSCFSSIAANRASNSVASF